MSISLISIIFLISDPTFIYNASCAVARLKLPNWAEPFAGTVIIGLPWFTLVKTDKEARVTFPTQISKSSQKLITHGKGSKRLRSSLFEKKKTPLKFSSPLFWYEENYWFSEKIRGRAREKR